jgi:hypothetical protein
VKRCRRTQSGGTNAHARCNRRLCCCRTVGRGMLARLTRAGRRSGRPRTARASGQAGRDGSGRPTGTARAGRRDGTAFRASRHLRSQQQLRFELQPGRTAGLGDLPRRDHRDFKDRRRGFSRMQQHAGTGLGAVHEREEVSPDGPGRKNVVQCRNQSEAISAITSSADTPCQNRTGERS